MKIRYVIKRLSNPRVRRRLKIGSSLFGGAILIAVVLKIVYDIGYFDAQALKQANKTELPTSNPVLNLKSAQLIVSGALKEDVNTPKTLVTEIVSDNSSLATVIIENNRVKKVGWIINSRLFFTGNLYNEVGINLTEGIERQYNEPFAR
jgi:hypothetical protein